LTSVDRVNNVYSIVIRVNFFKILELCVASLNSFLFKIGLKGLLSPSPVSRVIF